MSRKIRGDLMQQGMGFGLKMGLGFLFATALAACAPNNNDSSQLLDGDGSVGQAIVGGVDVPAGNTIIKSIVAVYDTSLGALCTGSLLPNNIVMTAAHCINQNHPEAMLIIFDIKISAKSEKRAVDKAQVSALWAANQDKESNTGDIALAHFTGTVPAGYEAATFLPSKKSLVKGAPVVLAGFGITNGVTSEGAGTLRAAHVTIYDPAFSVSEVKIDQTQGQGACHGDSGGPAYLFMDGKYYLWGITSRGEQDPKNDCTQYSIYTDALAYKAWIKKTTIALTTSLLGGSLMSQNVDLSNMVAR